MKRSTALTIILLCLALFFPQHSAQLAQPIQPVRVDPPAPSPCAADALFIFTAHDPAEMQYFLAQLEKEGGCAVHVFPPDAVIGGLPPEVETTLIDAGVISRVERKLADVIEFSAISVTAGQGAQAWNDLYMLPEPPVEPPPEAKPLVGDQRMIDPDVFPTLLLAPPPDARPLVGDQRMLDPTALPAPAALQAPPAPGTYDVSSFLNGKIAVGVIYLESNGVIDTKTEKWSQVRKDQVLSKIQSSLNWYATSYPRANLSFYYDVQTQLTSYEPISRSSAVDYLWINEVMGAMGYSQPAWFDRVHAYINALRSTNGTDWGLAVFVVDSLNDIDGEFTDGYFAYSTYLTGYNGFQIVMTYDNDGWGIASLDSVMGHEFGHVFGADDEYCQPGYACCWGHTLNGYLGIQNAGCEAKCDKNLNGVCDGNDSTPGSGCHNCATCVQPTCFMRSGSLTSGLCTTSREQMALRDSDADNRYDPVDTFPAFSLTSDPPYYNPSSSLTWAGTVTDTPWPSSTRNPVSINHIVNLQIQADGGPFTNCTATDGAFNAVSEGFSCTLTALPQGLHSITLRATNRTNNVVTWTDAAVVDTTPPTNPTLVTPGCIASSGVWQNTCPDANFSWSGATDAFSGLAGYYYYWGPSSDGTGGSLTVPPAYDPPPVANPSSSYLRVQAVDNAGNLAPWITLFNLQFDAAPPLLPVLTSSSHTPGIWSNDTTVDLAWWGAADGSGSGVNGYSIVMNPAPGILPDMIQDTTATTASSAPLADGTLWHFALRVQDNAGNWTPTAAEFGPFWIDTQPPNMFLALDTASLPVCAGDRLMVSWSGSDLLSGVSAYDVQYRSYGGAWTDWMMHTTLLQAQFGPSTPLAPVPGMAYSFRLRVYDTAGNVSIFTPDIAAPSAVIHAYCYTLLPVITRGP